MVDRPFTVDAGLTAIAIGYTNPASSYIADAVLPRQDVTSERFKWTFYALDESFNIPDARVGRLGRVQRLTFGGKDQTDSVEDYGYDSPIPNSDIDSAAEARSRGVSTFDPEGHAVMMITDTLLNQREVRVAALVQNPNTYSAGRKITLSGTGQFNDYANSDPIGVIKAGLDATLVHRPNQVNMGRGAWSKISSHPDIVNAVKGNVTGSGMVTKEQFVELFSGEGITELNIGDAWYNIAKPGQPVQLARAWGNSIALTHKNPIARPEGGGVTFGFTAEYASKIAGRIQDDDIGLNGGFRIRTGERIKEVICAADVGYLIQNAVAG